MAMHYYQGNVRERYGWGLGVAAAVIHGHARVSDTRQPAKPARSHASRPAGAQEGRRGKVMERGVLVEAKNLKNHHWRFDYLHL